MLTAEVFARIEAFAVEARSLSDQLQALKAEPGPKMWVPAMAKIAARTADFSETLYGLADRECEGVES